MSVVSNKRRKAKRKAVKEANAEPVKVIAQDAEYGHITTDLPKEEMIGHHGIGFETDALRQKELHEMPEKDIPT